MVTVKRSDFNPILHNEKSTAQAVASVCIALESQAVALADFKKGYQTGATRSSIRAEYDGNQGAVSVGTEYAPYLEFGTNKMEAQPFMTPAAEIVATKFKGLVISKYEN
jgi:HK97 gp10 family phage protein